MRKQTEGFSLASVTCEGVMGGNGDSEDSDALLTGREEALEFRVTWCGLALMTMSSSLHSEV